jgi:hypothetical protein
MRPLVLPLVLLLIACGSDNSRQEAPSQNAVQPAPTAPAAPRPATAAPAANAAKAVPDAVPDDDPGLAGLSPGQRRAYELGYRDCLHGRYAPANHLEAYRIGCGAAHDRMEGGRPQG